MKSQTTNIKKPEYFLKLFCEKFCCVLSNMLKFFLIHLMSINKLKLKKTADLLNETLNGYCHHNRFSHCFLAAPDVIESKIYK